MRAAATIAYFFLGLVIGGSAIILFWGPSGYDSAQGSVAPRRLSKG